MRKYVLPILFMSLLYWSCEPEPEDCTGEPGGNAICGCIDDNAVNYDSTATNDDGSCIYDTTEPSIQFTSPNPNDTLGGIITLRVEAQDDYEITKVEFKLHHLYEIDGETILEDDSLFTDTEEPYEYEWNSTEYEYVGASFSARAFDGQNDKDIHLYPVYIDNRPEPVNVTSVQYVWNEGPEYIVQWEESTIEDFEEYKLLWYNVNESSIDTIVTFTDRSVTSHNVNIVSGMPPTQANTFVILVKNELGFTIKGDEMENETLDDPTIVLHPVVVEGDSITLTWSRSTALGDEYYQIFEATSSNFGNSMTRWWYSGSNSTDTTITVPILEEAYGFDGSMYYKVDVLAPFGQECTSNIEPVYITNCNDNEISLWGDCYDVETTTSLSLYNSGLIDEIPPEIGSLTNLQSILLYGNNLIGPIPTEIGNLTNLERLDLHSNNLTGTIPHEIGNLINLFEINLEANQITGHIPSEIGNLVSLDKLNFRTNLISGPIPHEIGNLTNLEYLDIGGNQLSGNIPSEIGNLIELDFLHFRWNQLTGPIPHEIGNLVNLEWLFLQVNQLSGEIPSSIGNLSHLRGLHLDENQITGEIPPEIFNLEDLEWLTLNENQITGEIPESICNLVENNCTINISNNQLCPPYPSCIENYVGEQDTSDCD